MSKHKAFTSEFIREFYNDNYQMYFWLAIGCSKDTIHAMFDRINTDDLHANVNAMTWTATKVMQDGMRHRGIFIWFKDSDQFITSVIAHESTHWLIDVYAGIGESISSDCQEPAAYLLEWCARQCEQYLI